MAVQGMSKEVEAWFMSQNFMARDPGESKMVWVDIETTGLNPQLDFLLEISIIVTDELGSPIDFFDSPVLPAPLPALRERAGDYVNKMHEKSGLWDILSIISEDGSDEFRAASFYTHIIEQKIDAFLASKFGNEKIPMSGSSVHFDRSFLARRMPTLVEGRFSHRNIDVSSIVEIMKIVMPDTLTKMRKEVKPRGAHRGISDLVDTVDSYRWILKNVMNVT